ncbi:hypothetical protein MTR67_038557 [Solanum verrucosum]|uniref:Uncharacterized protein n=1 Tax=Solanum verrucosum TaxID=315347 RepID=A0AAF0UFN9_SOLVR|nr:hypothetical protein MTR67_038557 [Solanum verrucosum]
MNGNFVFKVKGTSFGWHDKRVILDAADNPLITLKQKVHINDGAATGAAAGLGTAAAGLGAAVATGF